MLLNLPVAACCGQYVLTEPYPGKHQTNLFVEDVDEDRFTAHGGLRNMEERVGVN